MVDWLVCITVDNVFEGIYLHTLLSDWQLLQWHSECPSQSRDIFDKFILSFSSLTIHVISQVSATLRFQLFTVARDMTCGRYKHVFQNHILYQGVNCCKLKFPDKEKSSWKYFINKGKYLNCHKYCVISVCIQVCIWSWSAVCKNKMATLNVML